LPRELKEHNRLLLFTKQNKVVRIKNMQYNPQKIELKWQEIWKKEKIYQPNLKRVKKPFYNLMMFPYPSAEGMHVGNMYAFTGSDIYGRFKRMKGFDVFEPIGLDGFGIHSENYALITKEHPLKVAERTEKNFYRQLQATGNGYAWENKLETYDPDYYKWTQWIFLQMFKNGLAVRKKALVNWCPSCKTVLSDEQVITEECERCGTKVVQKELEQWFFQITKYAERLLKNLECIDWSERIKVIQRNWIGETKGINIDYGIVGSNKKLTCFTTRPDTNFGATFIVISPENPLALEITIPESKKSILEYIEKSKKITKQERVAIKRKKTGVFTGAYCLNELTGKKIPIWVSDFVLMDVGTGAVVGVPGHDLRDFEFAKEFDLPIIRVVVSSDGDTSPITKLEQVIEEEGVTINSQFLNKMKTREAIKKIMDYLEKKKCGKRVTIYRLRDWCISRQRYWGPPIPMINCPKCGWVPVPEKDLPVKLPYVEDYRPKGQGRSPLAYVKEWVQVKCPQCKGRAKRETDVSDTFLDSAWYFLRYPSISFKDRPFDKALTQKWLPVDMYIGGAEHAVLHLMYTRFITMALHDFGYLDFEEPFKIFYAHGLITKEGAKMSKSKGNVVIPDEYIKKLGADTLRIYLMFLGPFNQGGDFTDAGIMGVHRFLNRIWKLVFDCANNKKSSQKVVKETHKLNKKISEDLEKMKFNTSIAAFMEFINFAIINKKDVGKDVIEDILILLTPFAPHITEELWHSLGKGDLIQKQSWPKYDSKLIKEETITLIIQINGKVRDKVEVDINISEEKAKKLALGREKIKKRIERKKIKKIIFVPQKLINIVI